MDEFATPETGIAVAITAAVMSPPVRRVLRRGAVLGLAGVLSAGAWVQSRAQGLAAAAQRAQPITDISRPGHTTPAPHAEHLSPNA